MFKVQNVYPISPAGGGWGGGGFFDAAKIYFFPFKNRFLKIIFLIINMLKKY
jgi:hypothetical protein